MIRLFNFYFSFHNDFDEKYCENIQTIGIYVLRFFNIFSMFFVFFLLQDKTSDKESSFLLRILWQ